MLVCFNRVIGMVMKLWESVSSYIPVSFWCMYPASFYVFLFPLSEKVFVATNFFICVFEGMIDYNNTKTSERNLMVFFVSWRHCSSMTSFKRGAPRLTEALSNRFSSRLRCSSILCLLSFYAHLCNKSNARKHTFSPIFSVLQSKERKRASFLLYSFNYRRDACRL